jgi:hypothetical protein
MGDCNIISLQAAVVPAWRLTMPFCWYEPTCIRRQRLMGPSYKVYFERRQTQEQNVAYREISPLVERPMSLTLKGMTAGTASSESASVEALGLNMASALMLDCDAFPGLDDR